MKERFLLICALGLATPAGAQEIPADAPHCRLQAPPDSAAKGFRAAGRQPMRLFPVNPGAQYTGCQWIWIAYGTPINPWDYVAVTYYEAGVPRIQRVTYPPLPVQPTVQTCLFESGGTVRRIVEGNDWQHACPSPQQLRQFLLLTPGDGAAWDFF